MGGIIVSALIIGYILLVQAFIDLDLKIRASENFVYREKIYKCESPKDDHVKSSQ